MIRGMQAAATLQREDSDEHLGCKYNRKDWVLGLDGRYINRKRKESRKRGSGGEDRKERKTGGWQWTAVKTKPRERTEFSGGEHTG